MNNYLFPYLNVYSKGFNTQYVLLFHFLKIRKKTLDNKSYTAAVIMEMSKAFDIINNELLIAKLHAYRFSKNALKLIFSYISERWQRTKINKSFSSWSALLQGVQQGSVLSSTLFNIYLNDLFYFLSCDTYILRLRQGLSTCT